jgi:outer membrane protein assembly factor BamA
MIEDGVRGGVRVIFEVFELPLIGEVHFDNLKVDRSVVIEALKKQQIDLQPGKPYDVETVKRAARIIKFLLAEIGQANSNVETRVENVSATEVNLTFVITPNQ